MPNLAHATHVASVSLNTRMKEESNSVNRNSPSAWERVCRLVAIRLVLHFLGFGILMASPDDIASMAVAQTAVLEAPATRRTATAHRAARQQGWLKASPLQRAKFAEQLGEKVARRFAPRKGWKPLKKGLHRRIPPGTRPRL